MRHSKYPKKCNNLSTPPPPTLSKKYVNCPSPNKNISYALDLKSIVRITTGHKCVHNQTEARVNLSIYHSIYLSNYLSIYLSIYPFVNSSIYLSDREHLNILITNPVLNITGGGGYYLPSVFSTRNFGTMYVLNADNDFTIIYTIHFTVYVMFSMCTLVYTLLSILCFYCVH